MFLIYCITNNTNGKRYIGQTSRTSLERWWEHQSAARCGQDTYLYRAIRKYGADSFSIKDIDKTKTNEAANQLEMFWIQTLGTCVSKYGYNGDAGGLGYYKPTEETLRKRSESIKKRYSEGLQVWCTRTDIPDNEVSELYKQGWTQRRIADKFNASKRTIAVRLHKMGVEQRPKVDPNRIKYIVSPETRQKMREAKLADPAMVERMRTMTKNRIEGRN
jgi:group I intron endonuclease